MNYFHVNHDGCNLTLSRTELWIIEVAFTNATRASVWLYRSFDHI